jgi:AcrR family transcriptional regulator
MDVPSQAGPRPTERRNQKLRTRAAIVEAARTLMAEGAMPTVAQAAEAALVSRTTAYRYFPTQETLLLELAMTTDVDDVEELLASPARTATPLEHLSAVLERFNEHVLDQEVEYRTSLRAYADLALAAIGADTASPMVREGRRVRWIETALDPLRHRIPPTEWRRLVAGLSVVAGSEAMIVMKDVCHLDREASLDASRWAVQSLVERALGTIDDVSS